MKSWARLGWMTVGFVGGVAAAAALARARRGDLYRRVYRFAYRVGFTPWDAGLPAPGLVDLMEGPSAPEPGRALDIGCGSGNNSVYLAGQGWDVTGVDMVADALQAARHKAQAARVAARFVEGDVTRLGELGLGEGFTLLVDIGCFHTLPQRARDAYVEGVTRLAAPGATFLMLGFPYGTVAPVRAGVDPDEIGERFRGWALRDARRLEREDLERHVGGPRPVARFASAFRPWLFLLERRSAR